MISTSFDGYSKVVSCGFEGLIMGNPTFSIRDISVIRSSKIILHIRRDFYSHRTFSSVPSVTRPGRAVGRY